MTTTTVLSQQHPLLVLPELAVKIGLNEALVLQQVHYWVQKNAEKGRNVEDGRAWSYNTYEDWQRDQFPFWSVSTVKRVFKKLREMGLLLVKQPSGFDRRLWVSVDYDALAEIGAPLLDPGQENGVAGGPEAVPEGEPEAAGPEEHDARGQSDTIHSVKMTPSIGSKWSYPSGQNDTMHSVNLTPSIVSNWHDRSGQNGTIDRVKMTPSYTETNTETTPEHNPEIPADTKPDITVQILPEADASGPDGAPALPDPEEIVIEVSPPPPRTVEVSPVVDGIDLTASVTRILEALEGKPEDVWRRVMFAEEHQKPTGKARVTLLRALRQALEPQRKLRAGPEIEHALALTQVIAEEAFGWRREVTGATKDRIMGQVKTVLPDLEAAGESVTTDELRAAYRWYTAGGISAPRDAVKILGMIFEYRKRKGKPHAKTGRAHPGTYSRIGTPDWDYSVDRPDEIVIQMG